VFRERGGGREGSVKDERRESRDIVSLVEEVVRGCFAKTLQKARREWYDRGCWVQWRVFLRLLLLLLRHFWVINFFFGVKIQWERQIWSVLLFVGVCCGRRRGNGLRGLFLLLH
jgi:hypothetical protein